MIIKTVNPINMNIKWKKKQLMKKKNIQDNLLIYNNNAIMKKLRKNMISIIK